MTIERTPTNVNINPNPHAQMKTSGTKFYLMNTDTEAVSVDEAVDEEFEDANKVIEESPNFRWSKLDTEIFVQKLIDFDSAHLAIDTEKGFEIAWNEMKFCKLARSSQNRFESVKTLECIYDKLKNILNFLIKLEHPNLLKFYDYWFVDNNQEYKIVVITEYSSAGSLKKLLDSSKMSQTKIKPPTYKRWLNQILYSIKCLHNDRISIFQGHLNSETIFIQNSGVIKLTPTLLTLNGICELANNLIRCSNNKKPNIDLTNEIMIKDLQAIGQLALEIFNAHTKIQSPTSPSVKSHRFSIQASFDILSQMVQDTDVIESCCLKRNLNMLEDELQKDFVLKCFNAGDDVNIDSIWFHPFINNIHSLKVLSVFSILTFFQDKKSSKRKLSNKEERLSLNSNLPSIKSPNDSTSSDSYPTTSSSFPKSGSNSSLTKSNSLIFKSNNFSEKRKVSLTFLTNYNNLKIPQDFFGILEDIRAGLYPRLFKHKNDSKELSSSTFKLRSISSSSCIDFVLQQKQIIDRRSSSNQNSFNDPEKKSSISSLTRISSSENLDEKNFEEENSPFLVSSMIKYPTEIRRVTSENCWIKKSDKNADLIELSIELKFSDNFSRYLCSYFPSDFLYNLKLDFDQENENLCLLNQNFLNTEQPHQNCNSDLLNLVFYNENTFDTKLENICNHLANELIDNGLINPKDHNLISELFLKTIKDHLKNGF